MATKDYNAYMQKSPKTAYKHFQANVDFMANFNTQDEAKNNEIYQFASAALKGVPRFVNGKNNPSWLILKNLCEILKEEGLGL